MNNRNLIFGIIACLLTYGICVKISPNYGGFIGLALCIYIGLNCNKLRMKWDALFIKKNKCNYAIYKEKNDGKIRL